MDQSLTVNSQPCPEPPAFSYQPSRRAALITMLLLAGMFAASVIYNPPGGNYATICGFKNLTGLPCPACGLTHSFCSLGKGDISTAFDYNLLGPVLFLYALSLFVRSIAVLMKLDGIAFTLDKVVTASRTIRILVLMFVVYGVLRITYLIASGAIILGETPVGRFFAALFG